MGFYSEVQIVAEESAFEKIKAILERHEICFEEHDSTLEETKAIVINEIDCYDRYEFVKEIREAFRKFDELDEDWESYGYKAIVLNEDNTTNTYFNSTGEEKFKDFCIVCTIDNPYRI